MLGHRRFQNGILFALFLGACFGIFLAGCYSIAANSPVVVHFSTWGSAEELAVIQERIHAFEQQHPTIHIDLIHIPENYFQKLHLLVASNLTPDVMFVNSLSYPLYAENQVFLPLEPLLTASSSGLRADQFFSPAIHAFTWKHHLYAIPRDVSDLVIFYNRDLFQKAGVPVPSPSWTLSQMLQTAQVLTSRLNAHRERRDYFGISFFAMPPHLWLPFVWSMGGTLFDSALTHLQLQQPQAVSALQFYADLRNQWHVAPTRADAGNATMSQLFLQGHLAMLLSGRWTVPILRQQAKFHWDVLPFPQGHSASVVGIDASGYAISKSSPHLAESWAWVQFLSSSQSQARFAQSGLIVPALKRAAFSPQFKTGLPRHCDYFIQAMATGRPTHLPPQWNEIEADLDVALEPLWEGTKTAHEVVSQVTPQIESVLNEH